MHGLINKAIERFVRDTCGDPDWDRIVATACGPEPIDNEAAIVPNLRQKSLMEDSLGAAEAICRELANGTPMEMVAIHFQEAIEALGQILGNNIKVDLLDQIFSRFCIGK